MLLKVHRSNFALVGFTEEVDGGGAGRARPRARGLPLLVDLGSGALVPLTGAVACRASPPCRRRGRGADVVAFSGDKLLGGPQAGILVGRRRLDRTRQASTR